MSANIDVTPTATPTDPTPHPTAPTPPPDAPAALAPEARAVNPTARLLLIPLDKLRDAEFESLLRQFAHELGVVTAIGFFIAHRAISAIRQLRDCDRRIAAGDDSALTRRERSAADRTFWKSLGEIQKHHRDLAREAVQKTQAANPAPAQPPQTAPVRSKLPIGPRYVPAQPSHVAPAQPKPDTAPSARPLPRAILDHAEAPPQDNFVPISITPNP